MKKLDDDQKLSDISLPGTHNSGSDYGYRFLAQFVACQEYGIYHQLQMGIRFFDIRCRRAGDSKAFLLKIHHKQAYQYLSLDDVLKDLKKFFEKYPSEGVVMRLKEEYTPERTDLPSMSVMVEKYLDDSEWSELFLKDEQKIPKIQQLRGKIILLVRHIKVEKAAHLVWNDNRFMKIQDYWYGTKTEKQSRIIQHYNENKGNQSSMLRINFISLCADIGRPIPKIAKDLNGFISEKFEENSGIVVMDYPNIELVNKLISFNDFTITEDLKGQVSLC
jgi:1-phosphatidylinositol phosphodiesterase